jgi:hypothetical protein
MSLGEKDTSQALGELQGKGDFFTKLSVVERKRLADLQDAIDHITSETDKYRDRAKKAAIEVMNLHVLTPNPAFQRADGVSVSKDAERVTTKALNILEAQLNKMLQMKSEILVRNKAIRVEIDHYRRVRLQTDSAHSKFEAVLAENKAAIEQRLAESTAVVEERDRLLEKRDALERINVEEQKAFEEQYEEMGTFIKLQNKALEESLLNERKQDQADKKNKGKTDTVERQGTFTLEEEIAMAQEVGTLTNVVLNEQTSLSGIQEKISSYESMFEQLKKMTGANTVEEVVSSYVAQEEEMFSLYNFIQTIHAEIDAVLESNAQIELDIVRYKQEQEDQNNQRKTVLDEQQDRLQAAMEVIRQAEDEYKVLQESVTQISKKVSTLFYKLQCDQMDSKAQQSGSKVKPSSMPRDGKNVMLLSQQGVSESNVLEFMGCIENRAVDIISDYLRLGLEDGAGAGAGGPAGQHRNRSPTPGPPSPMKWPVEPIIDVAEFSEDEFLLEANFPTSGGAGTGDEADKPVNLSMYKEKLKKKMGLGLTGSSSKDKLGSGPLGLSGSGKSRK